MVMLQIGQIVLKVKVGKLEIAFHFVFQFSHYLDGTEENLLGYGVEVNFVLVATVERDEVTLHRIRVEELVGGASQRARKCDFGGLRPCQNVLKGNQ